MGANAGLEPGGSTSKGCVHSTPHSISHVYRSQRTVTSVQACAPHNSPVEQAGGKGSSLAHCTDTDVEA